MYNSPTATFCIKTRFTPLKHKIRHSHLLNSFITQFHYTVDMLK
jgi:hypothetical protein